MISMPSWNAYAQEATRGDNGEYIFTEEAFLTLWREYIRLQKVEVIYEEYVSKERKLAFDIIESNDRTIELLQESQNHNADLQRQISNRYTVLTVVVIAVGAASVGFLAGQIIP